MWLLVACTAPPPADSGTSGPVDIARPADGWQRGDLHVHTNYSDDALEQGGDWMGPALAIADAWRDPTWKAAFPEYAPDDHLQFVAITDHRTDAGWSDPDFQGSALTVLRGEEFGSDGHAGIWGHTAHIPHEPQGTESANQRIQDAIDEAHAQGGLFSPNHPLYEGDLWAWDVTGFDAVEVWNGPWSTMGAPTTTAQLDTWVADHGGAENPWIRAATSLEGVVQNAQALRFWYATLADGQHPAPVGGGDRHMIFPNGLPTTYVNGEDVLTGIAAGRTFVSRSPQGPQVVLEATVGGESFAMGADLPHAETVDISWRVARATGGELRFVGGPLGTDAPETLQTVAIDGSDVSGTWTWTVPAEGGWVHALVVDPLPSEVPADRQDMVAAVLEYPEEGGIGALVAALAPIMDLEILGDPSECDPEEWTAWSADCMPVDTEPYATFYLPDPLQRLLSADFEDGAPTGYAMGALSAAFVSGP